MAVFFHLLFECFRIGILSLVYGFIIWYVLHKIIKIKNVKKWVIIPLIFIGLFAWRNSYWRDNGFGDSARVPLDAQYEIRIIDFWSASIYKDGRSLYQEGDANGIIKLYVEDHMLYAKSDNSYLIFNPETEELLYLSKKRFKESGGNPKKLITPDRFHSNYWGWQLLFF